MFLVTRVMTVEKGFVPTLRSNFLQRGLVDDFPGFIRKEIHVNDRSVDYSLVRINFYWQSKNDFIAWERSPAHLAQHKAHAGQPRPTEILSATMETYDVYVASDV